jgi:sugar phosphate isomerase/epimerase
MWKSKLCLGVSESFGIPIVEQIKLFHEVGFDGFFTGWDWGKDIKEWKYHADKYGMIYQSIHAPFTNAAKMWEKGAEADKAVDKYKACLYSCAENGVPIMVVHAFIGFESHNPNPYGVENFGKVVAEAEKLGVKIAFENTEGEEYLAELMRHLGSSKAVGFCWDTGHELCYNRSVDMFSLYGKKLICTHLNDNLGIKSNEGRITWLDDLHLLPFDGIADWDNIASRLDREGYAGELTFELSILSKPGRHENDVYRKLSIVEYFAEAYKRACRVAALRNFNISKESKSPSKVNKSKGIYLR